MIGDPPLLLGDVHDKIAVLLPGEATRFVAAAGAPAGWAFAGVLATPTPTDVIALTRYE